MTEYRCYTFGNMYLSSIQQGVQAAHAITEMFVKQYAGSKNNSALIEWAAHHKTMVCLNGGMERDLKELAEIFGHSSNPYPWAKFVESDDALGGALTCVAIIVPSTIYDNAMGLEFEFDNTINMFVHLDEPFMELTTFEHKLMEEIKSRRLAR